MGFFVVLIFDIYIKFLDKFRIVLLALSSTSTISSSLIHNAFKAKFDDSVVFSIEISGDAAILLKL